MRKYAATEKKVHIYEIQDTDNTPLDLMNVLTYKAGQLDRVTTFIGRHDRNEYISVGNAEDLSSPGVLFSYSSYVRQQQSFLPALLDMYHSNLHGKVYGANGSNYIIYDD